MGNLLLELRVMSSGRREGVARPFRSDIRIAEARGAETIKSQARREAWSSPGLDSYMAST